MTIHDLFRKFKRYPQNTDILLGLLIVLVSLTSFALGRFSVHDRTADVGNKAQVIQGIKNSPQTEVSVIEERDAQYDAVVPSKSAQRDGGYVASKNGTKYHLPWCGSAKSIKEENKVWFATKEEAEKAGYTPAANCKGI